MKSPHILVSIIILVFATWLVQYHNPAIIGADGYLHGRMAMTIGEGGFLHSLPQASYSLLATRFSDKDFVYHLYLLPFTVLGGYIPGTKAGAFVATAILYGSVPIILFLLTKSPKASWISVLLLCSSQLFRDSAEARPLVFALTLTLWGLYAISQERIKLLFFLSLVFGMTHLSAWLVPGFTILASIISWMTTGRGNTKLVLASLAGYALSFFIHPNFPNNIFYTYLNGVLVPFYAAKTGVLELGAEFFPLLTRDLVRVFPMLVGVVGILVLLWMLFQPKVSGPLRVWLLASLGLGLLGLISRRNLTHAYPVFVVMAGAYATAWFDQVKKEDKTLFERTGSVLFPVVIVMFAISLWVTINNLNRALASDRMYSDHFLRVSQTINNQVPKGEKIFHSNWSDTQYLIGLAPEHSYLVTFDPIYMYDYDPVLYGLYRTISHGQSGDPVEGITKTFGSGYVYSDKIYFFQFVNQLKALPQAAVIYEDDLGAVFKLN